MMEHEEDEEVVPNESDVLCGSGSMKAIHPGNQRFLRIVAKHYAEYAAASSKAEKMKASRRVMKEVLLAGTRFLKKDTGSQKWYVADLRVGKDKMSHCLRDIRNKKKRNIWAKDRQDAPIGPAKTQKPTHPVPQTSQTPNVLPEGKQQWHDTGPGANTVPPSFAPPLSKAMMLDLRRKRKVLEDEHCSAPAADSDSAQAPSTTTVQDAPAPISWDYAARAWEAHQQETAQPQQNPLLVEFAIAYSDKQPTKYYPRQRDGTARKVMHHHPSERQQEAPAQWHPSERDEESWAKRDEHQHSTYGGSAQPPPPGNYVAQQGPGYYQWPSTRQQYAIDPYSRPLHDFPDDGRWTPGSTTDGKDDAVASTFYDWRSSSPGWYPPR